MIRPRTPDWLYGFYSNPALRALLGWDWRRRDIRWLRCTSGRIVVEVGSGGGFYTGHMVRRIGSGSITVVLDPSASAVAALCRHLGGSVVGVCGDGHNLPFARGSVDGLFYGYSLEEFDDPCAGVREAERVLRPGGQLVLFLWRPGLHGRRLREVLTSIEHDFVLERASDGPQNLRRSYERCGMDLSPAGEAADVAAWDGAGSRGADVGGGCDDEHEPSHVFQSGSDGPAWRDRTDGVAQSSRSGVDPIP